MKYIPARLLSVVQSKLMGALREVGKVLEAAGRRHGQIMEIRHRGGHGTDPRFY